VKILEKEQENKTIVLHDEEGKEWEFEVVDIITVNNNDYALLLPLEDNEDDEVYVFRIQEDENGNQILVDLDDEEELEMVEKAWEELEEEQYNDRDYEEEE
jgi:uncharacterized protein YrzB (UPF0473 family)